MLIFAHQLGESTQKHCPLCSFGGVQLFGIQVRHLRWCEWQEVFLPLNVSCRPTKQLTRSALTNCQDQKHQRLITTQARAFISGCYPKAIMEAEIEIKELSLLREKPVRKDCNKWNCRRLVLLLTCSKYVLKVLASQQTQQWPKKTKNNQVKQK